MSFPIAMWNVLSSVRNFHLPHLAKASWQQLPAHSPNKSKEWRESLHGYMLTKECNVFCVAVFSQKLKLGSITIKRLNFELRFLLLMLLILHLLPAQNDHKVDKYSLELTCATTVFVLPSRGLWPQHPGTNPAGRQIYSLHTPSCPCANGQHCPGSASRCASWRLGSRGERWCLWSWNHFCPQGLCQQSQDILPLSGWLMGSCLTSKPL